MSIRTKKMFLMVLLGFFNSVDILNGLLSCVPERGKTEVGFLFVLPVTFFGGGGKDTEWCKCAFAQ